MYPIATWVNPTNTSENSFINIPQNFTHLQLRIIARSPSSSASPSAGFTTSFDCPYFRFNGDATAANYSDHMLYGDGSTAGTQAASGTITAMRAGVMPANNATANIFGVMMIDILDYSNTNKNKTIRILGGSDTNGAGYAVLRSGLWNSTAAINQIYLGGFTQGFLAGSRFDLYGITSSIVTGA